MKKRLLILVFAIGMMSQTQSKAAITNFCFTDVFGFVANVTATKTSPGYWELSGTADVLVGYDYTITGYFDKASNIWSITFINPLADACETYADYFTYTSTSYGPGYINFNWDSYCSGEIVLSSTGSTTFTTGPCMFRTSDREPNGPVLADADITSQPVVNVESVNGGPIFSDLFTDASLTVINNSKNNIAISYELSDASNVEIAIYNHVGQFVTTIVNENQTEGFYNTYWDGKTTNGVDALEGMYIVVMKTDGESISSKFVK